jgi:Xaa-Pro aminopeptidase
MAKDWNQVRHNLDSSTNFASIYNSPYYEDAVYDKFSETEYQRRYAHARKIMERDGFDALLFTGAQSIYRTGDAVTWATGLIDARGMCQYVIFPKEGDPTLIYPHAGSHIEAARRMVSTHDVRSSEGGQYGKVIADRLKELGVEGGHIGITACDRHGPEYMGMKAYGDMVELLPNATFEFLPNLLHELTKIKSEEEIEVMAKAGELALEAMKTLVANAKPGIYEYQLAAAGSHAVLNGGGRVHLMMIGSTSMQAPKLVFPNPLPSHRVLTEGDLILPEIIVLYKGYYAKLGHPITIGPPTSEIQTFFKDVVLEGYYAIQAELMPGKTLEEVRLAGKVFREKGAQSRPSIVHGVDLLTASPNVHIDRVKALPGDEVIQPGNVFCIDMAPMQADGSYGLFMTRTFVITEDGHRNLVPFPADEIAVASV